MRREPVSRPRRCGARMQGPESWGTAARMHRARVGAAVRVGAAMRVSAAARLAPLATVLAAALAGCAAPAAPAATESLAFDSGASRARAALARGDVDAADAELKLAIQADPLDAESHHVLACLLARRGEREQAIVGFQRAVAADPTDADAAYNCGTLLLVRGDPVRAARWLETAVGIRPDAPRMMNNLAKAYFLAGLPELAMAAYDETLRHDATNAAALRGLAALAEAGGLAAEAAEYRRRLEAVGGAAAIGVPDTADPSEVQRALREPAPSDGEASGGSDAGAAVPGSDASAHLAVRSLRELLRDLPTVTVERRGDRTVVAGWTNGAAERELLGRVLATHPDVLDLTGDGAGDPRRMIEVDATIFLVLDLDSSSYGFNFLRLIDTTFSYFATDHDRAGTGFTAPGSTGLVGDAMQQGWMFTAAVDYDVNIANAAQQRVAVLARPHLTTLSGTPAKFLAGGEYVFRVAGNISGDIKPYPFGTTLSVTPTLLRDATAEGRPRVHMKVNAGRTSILAFLTEDDPSGSTVFDKLEVSSEAVLAVDQTLVLSGLSLRENRTLRSGVPLLMDVPLLGYLFSTETEVESNTAVVMLLTPRDPGYYDERNRSELARFVDERREYMQARAAGDEAMRQFTERHPDWAKIPPNRFASHFFLLRTSEMYRAVSGRDLTTETLEFGLLNGDGN